jgi:hypothetical protein
MWCKNSYFRLKDKVYEIFLIDYFKAAASIGFEKLDRGFCFWLLNKFIQTTKQICQNSFSCGLDFYLPELF